MKVKICGLTRLDDALVAAEAGADMLGFNFYPQSPRYIPPTACARLMEGLQNRGISIVGVGVFVNTSPTIVASILQDCGLQMAQLHGDEPPADLRSLGGHAFKAIRPRTLKGAREAMSKYTSPSTAAPALLLDAHQEGCFGGTGHQADWGLAAELAKEVPLLLAGGLTPETVTEALTLVLPWGVDVASGIESAPGCKDHRRMISFIRAVRQFESEGSRC